MRGKRFLCMAAAVLMILFCFAFSSNEVHASSGARLSKKSVTMTVGEKYKLRMMNRPNYEKTIVRVIPLGHAESGAEALAHEKGKVRLELVK